MPDETTYDFEDVLTGDVYSISKSKCVVHMRCANAFGKSLFFPGCSLYGYAADFVSRIYGLLKDKGQADCISLSCCGKPLSYRQQDKGQEYAKCLNNLAALIRRAGVERVICACPNCRQAMLEALSDTGVEVAALPEVLADCEVTISNLPAFACAPLTIHDSCPDRAYGRFAKGLRELLGQIPVVEMEHNLKHSRCCGSRIRSAGKLEAAAKQAKDRVREATDSGANGIVTVCMSCTRLLSIASEDLPVYHYLELMLCKRVDWKALPEHLDLRFFAFEQRTPGRSYTLIRQADGLG